MANALYDLGRQAFLEGDIAILTDTINIVLIDTDDYTADLATDQYLSDIPAGARVATTTLGSKTSTDGVFDAADATFTAVSGDESEAIVIYKHTGVEGTSQLIAYIDTATGLPVIPSSGDITVTWDAGVNAIFKL